MTVIPRRRQHAFTLLELVVVLAVFSVVAVMAYGGLNNVLAARVAIEDNLRHVADLQRAYLRLREDFQQIAPRTVRDGFGLGESSVIGRREEGVSLVSSGWRNPAGHARSEMQRVSWRLEDGALLRSTFRHLDRAPDARAEDLRVLEGIDAMTFRYLDGRREWQPEWPPNISRVTDPEASAVPPLAIEITLESRQWGEMTLLFPTGTQLALTAGGAGIGPEGATAPGGVRTGPGIQVGPGDSGVRVGP